MMSSPVVKAFLSKEWTIMKRLLNLKFNIFCLEILGFLGLNFARVAMSLKCPGNG